MACMSTATETAKKELVPEGSYVEQMTAQHSSMATFSSNNISAAAAAWPTSSCLHR